MKNVILLVLLFTVLALCSAMPKNCRDRNCRHFRPRPLKANGPAAIPLNKRPVVASKQSSPQAPPPARVPAIQAKAPVAEKVPVTKEKMVMDTDGKEVREDGVNGWMSSPTPSPEESIQKRVDVIPEAKNKPGSCDTPKGFGIKCMMRLDQCMTDDHCPGSTKCCMVGECGYLCVKPKPISTEPKEVTKETLNKKTKGKGKGAEEEEKEDLTIEASELVESVELPEGALKAEDIIEMPKKVQDTDDASELIEEEEEKEEEEEEKEKAQQKKIEITEGELEKEEAEEEKEEEELLVKEVEKVVEKAEEVLEEEVEKVVEKIIEEVETSVSEEEKTLPEE